MKRLFAFLAAFVIVAAAGATLNIAQANTNSAPALTTTPSSTATPTETSEGPTATATETQDPCTPPPLAPELLAPQHQAVLQNKTRIKLRWSKVDCANKYRILVRRDSRTGEPVARGHTGKTKAFVNLEPGHSYFWNIKACIDNQCTRSTTRKFTLPAPPTPTPTVTPTRGPTRAGTPSGPNPGGTPVPGNPPGQLNDYRGPSVYLSDDGSRVYYADCSGGWVNYRKGSGIATVTLWFYPNEAVSYIIKDFNLDKNIQTGTLQANSQGFLTATFDTSSWVTDHYHFIFDGKTSKVNYCGHFQLFSDGGIAPQEHGPHTPEEMERIRRTEEIESE